MTQQEFFKRYSYDTKEDLLVLEVLVRCLEHTTTCWISMWR